MRQHPIHSRLTPDPAEAPLPAGFRTLRLALDRSLPSVLAVPGLALDVLLSVPTGRVGYWQALSDETVIAEAAPQRAPFPTGARGDDPRGRAVPTLILSQGRTPMALLPLVVNARTLLPRTGMAGSGLEIVITGFSLTALAMRGPGAGSSWVELGWRPVSSGTDAFMAPVVRPGLRDRLVVTTGAGAGRGARAVDASLFTDAGSDAASGGVRGGTNWRLTHDEP